MPNAPAIDSLGRLIHDARVTHNPPISQEALGASLDPPVTQQTVSPTGRPAPPSLG